jgi:penicillin G amidase
MKLLKSTLCLIITLSLVYALNRPWNFGTPIPPLGKFLDPFHGIWKNAETKNLASENLTLPGLKDEVSIIYDSLKIPHIFAKNDDDLYFAQGYVTAKDRLWQMEFQTHAAAGRVSEIIGKAALNYDRGQRRMGMVFGAENSVRAMEADPTAKAMIDSYTRGINAYIGSLSEEQYPIEYKLLGYSPEPWNNLKVGLLLMNMALTLNTGEKDLEMTNALKLFGKGNLDLLYPDYENSGDPIVDNAGNWKFKAVALDTVPLALPSDLVHIDRHRQDDSENGEIAYEHESERSSPDVGSNNWARLRQTEDHPGEQNTAMGFVGQAQKSSPDVGSNNWAVSGSKTSTGSPMLCNDPHLNLNLPSIWYVIHLNAPGVNVMGASLPGAPAIISGFNDSIAWGVTNAQRDVVDWYKIKFKDKSKDEYLSDGRWKSSRKVVEKIVIKNGGIFYDTVVYTHLGPVRYDESFEGEKEKNHFAYRWISHDGSREVLTFYKLNRGKNHHDYLEALDHYSAPAQNFVFASVQGDVAMRIQGKYPVRRKEEGKFILDGSRTSQEWKAFIPSEQNVMYKNPVRGFVSSANQYPADTTYPYYINGNSWEEYRNRRINKILGERNDITPQDLMHLQLDVFNLRASECLPFFLSSLDTTKLSPAEQKAFHVLKTWDFNNTVDSEGASYYQAWWRKFYPLVWDEMAGSKVALEFPTEYITIRLMKENSTLSFFDILGTPEKETAKEVIQKSFSSCVAEVEKWKSEHPASTAVRWADFKDTFVAHLLRLPAFSYHVQHGGGADIVDASTRGHGPSWRMVVSLEKSGIKAWGVYPGGQSGNAGSPYYNSLLDKWSMGEYYPLHFTATPVNLKNYTLAVTTLKSSSK